MQSNRKKSLSFVMGGVFLLSSIVALCVGLILYPLLQSTTDSAGFRDPDRYEALGYSLYKNHVLAYYPDIEPTILRGPIYPAFIAASFFLSENYALQWIVVGQSVLFACTVTLVFWITLSLSQYPLAVIATSLCLFNPFLLWYVPRTFTEILGAFFFTALIASTLFFSLRPSFFRAALVGALLGLASLTKTTFLPLIFLCPILMYFILSLHSIRFPLCVFLISCLVIFPWTLRNWNLTKTFIPVQALIGYNMELSDNTVRLFQEKGFSASFFAGLYNSKPSSLETPHQASLPLWKIELQLEKLSFENSLKYYQDHPLFLVDKILFNAVAFWILSENIWKVLILAFVQVSCVVAPFVYQSWRIVRQKRKRNDIEELHVILVWSYFLLHLPVFALARFSVVLLPTMILYVVLLFFRPHESEIDIRMN